MNATNACNTKLLQSPTRSRLAIVALCLIGWLCIELGPAFAQPAQIQVHARHRPPDMFVDDAGQISGPLYDIVNRAAEIAGVTPNWEVRPMAFSLGALEQGIDIVLPRLYRSSEREGYVDFHGPLKGITKQVIFITDTRRPLELTELSDLFGKVLGVRMRGFYGTVFEADKRLNRNAFRGEDQLITELDRGTIEVIAITNLAAFERISEEKGYNTWEVAEFVIDQDESVWIWTVKGSRSSEALRTAFQELVETGSADQFYSDGLPNN